LKVLDQRTGPENVEAETQARPIAVYNTSASEVAQIVQQVYQDRMSSGGGGVMSPADMMKMIRGGNNSDQQVQKMSIAVDTRNNILVVRAPDTLFKEVKALVNELDQSLADSPQTTKVVSLQHTNSAAVQKALISMLGNVKTSTTPAQTTSGSQPGQTASSGGDEDPEDRMRRMRRNWEMMQEMRRMQESAGGDRGGDRGGFDRGRSSRGGSDRGRGSDGERGGGDRERGRGGRGE